MSEEAFLSEKFGTRYSDWAAETPVFSSPFVLGNAGLAVFLEDRHSKEISRFIWCDSRNDGNSNIMPLHCEITNHK
ncbi:MAG: hypothetical protein LBH00_09650 [Planctomycetaceae bacterium]|jgi:hypothetical protein|nr:hypothetical protein [Planctomycetaceae bacterium]